MYQCIINRKKSKVIINRNSSRFSFVPHQFLISSFLLSTISIFILISYAFMQLRIRHPFIRGCGVLFVELDRGPS